MYLSPLLAAVSIHISLVHIYGTWREDAVPEEACDTAYGSGLLSMDRLSLSAFVDLWQRPDWWELVKKTKKKRQYYSKKGQKSGVGK